MDQVSYRPELGAETTLAEYVPTVVIGGGQAGLVMGYHLQRAGERFVVLESTPRIGDSWRRRWDSLRLFSFPRYASLPGWRISVPSFPTRDEMADYLEAYAEHFDLPVRCGVRVDRLSRDGDDFLLELSAAGRPVTNGQSSTASPRRYLRAGRVILAIGACADPWVPSFASELKPSIRQVHSVTYRNPSQLSGDVLIVGGGNSGADIGLEAARAGHRTWVAGRHPGQIPVRIESRRARIAIPLIMFFFRRVLTLDTPMGRKAKLQMQGHAVPLVRNKIEDLDATGIVRLGRIAGVVDGKPMTADGEVLDPDTLVWCTGFRPDFSWIDLPVLGADGELDQNRGVSAVPGLFFLGQEFQYAAASATIQGLNQDARYLMRVLGHSATTRPETRSSTDDDDLEAVRITVAG
jgi:putative flavoprotein involved in K+ transport